MKWQVVLIIVCITRAASNLRTSYHVLPSGGPSMQCPIETTCPSLMALLNSEVLHDNITNVTLLLLPGMHEVTSTKKRTFSITSATNFVIRSVDSSQRATIACSGNIGFEFDSCTNLTISDINIQNCTSSKHLGFHSLQEPNFSLYITHSLGVYITHTSILNGTGIGLLLENVQYQVLILNSKFYQNDGNLHILTYNSVRVKSVFNSIAIVNSSFSNAKGTGGNMYSGITVRTYQTKFYIEIALKNVNIANSKLNIFASLNLCTSAIKLNNLTSISINKKQNIYFHLMRSTKCIQTEQQNNATIDNANFTGGEIDIRGKTGHPVSFFIKNSTIFQSIISITDTKNVVLTDVTIEKSDSQKKMTILSCSLKITGYFLYQKNGGSLVFIKSNVIFDDSTNILFKYNSQFNYRVSTCKCQFNNAHDVWVYLDICQQFRVSRWRYNTTTINY